MMPPFSCCLWLFCEKIRKPCQRGPIGFLDEGRVRGLVGRPSVPTAQQPTGEGEATCRVRIERKSAIDGRQSGVRISAEETERVTACRKRLRIVRSSCDGPPQRKNKSVDLALPSLARSAPVAAAPANPHPDATRNVRREIGAAT